LLKIVKGADEDKDHLLVQGGNFVPDKEDDSAKLTSNGDCVNGVHFLVVVGFSRGNEIPVDDPWFDEGGQLDKKFAVRELGVAEAGDWIYGRCPVEHVLLSLTSKDIQVVESYELPDNGKDCFFILLLNVLVADSDHLDTDLFSCVEGNLAVDLSLEDGVGLLLDAIPLDGLVVDLVDGLAQDNAIIETIIQVIDEDILSVHVLEFERVNPEAERSFLPGSRDVIVDQTGWIEFFLGHLFETVLGVEHLGNEDDVDLDVTFDEILCTNNILAAHVLGVLDEDFGALKIVCFVKSIQRLVIELV